MGNSRGEGKRKGNGGEREEIRGGKEKEEREKQGKIGEKGK